MTTANVQRQMSPNDVSQIRETLAELDSIIETLIEHKDLERATQFSLRALDVRRQCFGLGSEEMEVARVKAAQLIVSAAKVQQAKDNHKEAAELLAHVDSLTEHELPQDLISVDRCRRVTRLQMMKELMITRYRQGRHRSALTFGRHVLELARDTMCLYELPTLHLNIATVYSALGQHKEALRHCYVAFQKLCLIIEAVDDPQKHPFGVEALNLEPLDRHGVDGHRSTFPVYVRCCELVRDELTEEVDMDTLAPNFRSPSSFDGSDSSSMMNADGSAPMPEERRRWGGTLALAFRSLAAEQEHLGMLDGALLTYKVAHTTALSCLGAEHPVCLQCEQALRDAEQASKSRLTRVSSQQGKKPSSSSFAKADGVQRSKSALGSNDSKVQSSINKVHARSNLSSSQSNRSQINATDASNPLHAMSLSSSTRKKLRPAWNEWFNSDRPVPSHVEDAFRESQLQHGSYNTSFEPAADISSVVDHIDLPPRAQSQQSSYDRPPRHAHHHSDHHQPFPVTASDIVRRPVTRSSVDADHHRSYRHDDDTDQSSASKELPPLTMADYSFLQNTFKLRYDIHFNRPNLRFGTLSPLRRREERERAALAAELQHAEALAKELFDK